MRKSKARISQLRRDVRYLCNQYLDMVKQMTDYNAITALTQLRTLLDSTFKKTSNNFFEKGKGNTERKVPIVDDTDDL